MKIMTKLKTASAIAFAAFCVGSAQAKTVRLSVADWPDRRMRDCLQAIEIEGGGPMEPRYEKEQLEQQDWYVEVEDGVSSCMIRVEMRDGGEFDYSAVTLAPDWSVKEEGLVISGKVSFKDKINIPAPAEKGYAVTWDASSANARVEVRAEVEGQGLKSDFESGTKLPNKTRIDFTVRANEGYGYMSKPEGWTSAEVRDDVIVGLTKKVQIAHEDVSVEIPVATKIVKPGSEDNPWKIGGDTDPSLVTAYTNGAEFVIQGEGTVAKLAEVIKGWGDFAGDLTAIKVADSKVTGAVADAFAGIGGTEPVALTLPDGWQGELPDEEGNWYGVKVNLTAMPTAVKNVKFQQRYPWNGKVDITCDLTGAGKVKLSVAVYTNGVVLCEKPTIEGETVIDLDAAGGVMNGVKLVWDASTDLPAGFKAKDVKVKVTAK